MIEQIIYDLLKILAAGFAAGLICRVVKAPMLVGYLVIGIFLGSGGFGLVSGQHHEIEYFAEAGALLMLFSIGLNFHSKSCQN